MRGKNEGKGEIASAFQGAWRGFGFPTSSSELEKVNKFRTDKGKPILNSSPGIAFLEYGMHKECKQCNSANYVQQFLQQVV